MRAYQLKIMMKDLPTVSRKLIVPEKISLAALHAAIQYAMGWQDYHLYEFSTDHDATCYTNDREGIGEYEYYSNNPPAVPDEWDKMILSRPLRPAETVLLKELFSKSEEINYLYDFGDYWELRISLERVVDDYPHSFARCLEAAEAGPPEDVGGTNGFMDFLEAWHDPAHPEHSGMVTWGTSQGFTGNVDPDRINLFLRQKLPLGRDVLSQTLFRLNQEFLLFDQPIAFNPLLDAEQAISTHLLSFFTDFLRVLEERGPVRLTAKGNLPVKLVKELFYERGYDYAQAEWRVTEVHREADAWFLEELHDLVRLTGLIKKRKGRLSLTKKGERFLRATSTENYYTLFWDYLITYNMGYEQGDGPLPHFLYRYLLALLADFGGKEREIGFYADKLINIYPLLLVGDESEEHERYWFKYGLYARIMQRPFAEFGLVETRSERSSGGMREKFFVQKTPFFDHVFVRW